jgi:hypothetical protein
LVRQAVIAHFQRNPQKQSELFELSTLAGLRKN